MVNQYCTVCTVRSVRTVDTVQTVMEGVGEHFPKVGATWPIGEILSFVIPAQAGKWFCVVTNRFAD